MKYANETICVLICISLKSTFQQIHLNKKMTLKIKTTEDVKEKLRSVLILDFMTYEPVQF